MTGAAPAPFVHATRSLRVVFGPGTSSRLPEELERLGVRRPLVVATPRGAEAASDLVSLLGERVAGTFDGARVHVPSEVAEAAVDEARRSEADGLVAPGGGSAIGVAKAVALETGLPILAVPTTYSGSEMTAVWGVTEGDRKRTGRDGKVAPRVVVYDPDRTLDLPADTSALSGVNALAHAVEALYAHDATPLSGLLAEEGIRALARGLPEVVRNPQGLPGRTDALYGAHLAGWSLDLASMGLQHKLAHVLGGTFRLPHALVHAILLPHVAAFNEPAAAAAMERVARALAGVEESRGDGTVSSREGAEADRRSSEGGTADPASSPEDRQPGRAPRLLAALNRSLGITRSLRDLGLGSEDLELAAELAVRKSYPNPREVTARAVRELLRDAWEGRSPGSGTRSPFGSDPP